MDLGNRVEGAGNERNAATGESATIKSDAGTLLLSIPEDDDEDCVSMTEHSFNTFALPFPSNLRRNSISMPSGINALEEFEALRLKHQMARLPEGFEANGSVFLNEGMPTDCAISGEKSEIMTAAGSASEPLTAEVSCDDNNNSCNTDANNNSSTSNNENQVCSEEMKNADDDDDDWGFPNAKKKDRFRSRRRASIAPLPALRLNDKEMLASDYDTYSLGSNQTSITSINSVANLLRGKVQAFPQMIRKKKRETKDYKLKIFVMMMFFIIIFLVTYAYIGYHHHVNSRSYFDYMKFDPIERVLKILKDDEESVEDQSVVIEGQLGVTIDRDNHPFHCLADHRRTDGSLCIEWNGMARLYMNYHDRGVFRCYRLYWQALNKHMEPTDCYELFRENGAGMWFGGGITKDFHWSLSEIDFDYAPYTSGDARIHQFGNGVRRYFINSLGVAISVEESTPLYLKVNTTSNQFCLKAKHDDFTYVNHFSEYPELSYTICTTSDMKSLHTLMTQKNLWDGLKETDIKMLHSLIEEPIWQIPYHNNIQSINETTVYEYSEEVISMGFMSLGHILINEFWQENIGDFTIDEQRFPTFKKTIDVLHRRGFKVVFTIQPFISTDSFNFKEAVRKKLLIYERHSERSIPALTRYKSATSAGVLDITNNVVVPWVMEKLNNIQENYQVDSFYLDLGVSYNLPHYYQCRQMLLNSDKYSRYWMETLPNINFMGISTASAVHRPPTFLSILPTNSSWAGLQQTLMSVLNYGLIGYPFVLPGAIGGDYSLLSSNVSSHKMIFFYSLQQPKLPDKELYVRWLQLAIFLPAMQFSHLPTEYHSDYVMTITKELMTIRKNVVVPLLKKYLAESLNDGMPLVRPLWMLDPHDASCLIAHNEFSVGEELIVAPILWENIEDREVYLPQGVWKDGIDGSLRKGNRWIHNYKVPKDKVAYFIKMPDNTRF